jgi:flagellar hook protein FlgE
MDPSEGVVLQDVIEPIEFNDDGTFRTTGDPTIVLDIDGFDAPQLVRFSFSSDATLQSLNNQGNEPTALSVFQDGFKPGTLRAENVKVDADGSVVGIANGRNVLIAQLAVVSFQNPKGLVAIGDNLFTQSLNSGDPELGIAGTGSRGQVSSGQLESSNVDIAFEFTRLIVAQRGFSANARTITVSDEVLEELTNIIR